MGSVATLSSLLILWFNYWGRCYPPERWVLLCAAGKPYHRSRSIAQRWINWGERKRCRGGRLFPEQSKRDGSRKVSSECLNHRKHFPELLMRCHFQESMFSSSSTISITKTKVSLPRANVEILPYVSFLPVEFPQANSLWENSFLSTSEHDPGTHPPSHPGHSPGMNDTYILLPCSLQQICHQVPSLHSPISWVNPYHSTLFQLLVSDIPPSTLLPEKLSERFLLVHYQQEKPGFISLAHAALLVFDCRARAICLLGGFSPDSPDCLVVSTQLLELQQCGCESQLSTC